MSAASDESHKKVQELEDKLSLTYSDFQKQKEDAYDLNQTLKQRSNKVSSLQKEVDKLKDDAKALDKVEVQIGFSRHCENIIFQGNAN